MGLRVCPQTDCPALPWMGLVLGHVGEMLCMLCHEYTRAETHLHSPRHLKVHLSEHGLSQHSPRTLPPFPCLSRGWGLVPKTSACTVLVAHHVMKTKHRPFSPKKPLYVRQMALVHVHLVFLEQAGQMLYLEIWLRCFQSGY